MESGKNRVLLSSAFLAPVQYYTKLLSYQEVGIEQFEHFLKQSYRNRTTILSANGPQNLTVPVTEGSNSKRLLRDVIISYDHPWQKLHWRALLAAYNNAPFFEYYCDSLKPFFQEKRWRYLIDFNEEIQQVILAEMNLKITTKLTEFFASPGEISSGTTDFRYAIHPKTSHQQHDENFIPVVYMQVFQEKFGFTPNLGILDLLFNEGPMAVDILKKSTSQKRTGGLGDLET